jgi:HK97 family phage prohead protease
MKQKVFTAALKLKEAGEGVEEGEFSAVFSTLNVKDLHDDVTVPGAFTDGQEVVIEPWNHGWTLPVGKAAIRADEKEAKVEGRFFLDTSGGLDHYRTVKNLGGLAQWSYTFDVLRADTGQHNGETVQFLRKLDVVGVGPVTRGAGIDTRTVGIKQADKEPPEKKEPDSGEGEAPDQGKPSGVVRVTRTRIDLIELED